MKILIVDDDPAVVDLLSEIARVKGYTDITTASSGEEALAQVIQDCYNLITLDIRMRGVGGMEVLSPVRNLCPHAIIAIISGHIPEESSSDLAGCADVMIAKPIRVETFNHLLDCADRVSGAIEEACNLGSVPFTVRGTF